MYIDYFSLSILLILIGLAFLIRYFFSKRYGKSLATKVVAGIFGISLLIAIVTFEIISRNISEQAFPAMEWQQYLDTQQSITKLEYHSSLGLFAIEDNNKVKITDKNPFCVTGGQLSALTPIEIEILEILPSELPLPPQTAVHQINFILHYPIEADEIAFSSFAVFQNGEVWCTERYMRGGFGGAVAIGFLGFAYFVISALVFLGSLILSVVVAVISLEIYRRRNNLE